MNAFDIFVSPEATRAATTLAVNILLQSSLIVLVGLLAARMLRNHGAAVQSTVLRVTLIAVLACPFASWLLTSAGVAGFGVELPRPAAIAVATDSEETSVSRSVDVEAAVETDTAFATNETDVATRSQRMPLQMKSSDSSYEANAPAGPIQIAESSPTVKAVEPIAQTAPVQQETSNARIPAIAPITLAYAVAVAVWLLVAALLFARILLANAFVLRGRARASMAAETTVSLCESLARAIGVSMPDVRVSSRIQSPCLVGVVRPAILLPEAMKVISRDVLVHELAHLRRRDCVWQLLSCLTTAAFWFQPLVWMLSRRIEQTADDVADDFVVQFGNDRAEYARQLVDIAERYQPEWSAACVGAGIVSFKSSLGKRVVRILDTSRSPSTRTSLVALTAIVLLGVTCTLAVGLLGTGSSRAVLAADDNATTASTTSDSDTKDSESNSFTYHGRVFDPDGKPFAGAKLYLTLPLKEELSEQSHATSDKDGRFKFTLTKSDFSTKHRERPWEWVGSIIAVADGFGLGSSDTYNRNLGEPFELHLAKADLPVSGRILDLQGQPIAGVQVHFNSLHIPIPGKGGVDAWLQATKGRRDGMDLQRKYFSMTLLPSFLRGQDTQTDDDGKFSLPGFGRDRIVSVVIESPMIETQELCFVTRENLSSKSIPWYSNAPQLGTLLYYSPGADHVAAPTRRVIGAVTDKKTGEPLAGFHVASEGIGNPRHPVEAITDEEGRYELTGLPLKGQLQLSVTPPEDQPYITISHSIHLQVDDKPKLVDFEVPRGVWAEGHVVDKATGKSTRARVSYFVPLTNEALETLGDARLRAQFMNIYTDQDGRFRTPVLPGRGIIAVRGQSDRYLMGTGAGKIEGNDRGRFRTVPFILSAAGYHTVVEVNPSKDDEKVAFTVELDPGATALGRVLDPDGKPLAGTHVRGVYAMSYWRKQTKADFEASGFASDKSRRLLFWHEERNLVGNVVLAPDNKRVDVTLKPGGSVVGRLLDDDGVPWTNVKLRSKVHQHDINGRHIKEKPSEVEHDFISLPQSQAVHTDSEGRFTIPGLVPGESYSFAVDEGNRGGIDFIDNVSVKSGETKDLGDVRPLRNKRNEEARAALSRPDQGAAATPLRQKVATSSDAGTSQSSVRPTKSDTVNRKTVRGFTHDPNGKPIAGAFVAVVALNVEPKPDSEDLSPWGEVLGETVSGDDGSFELQLNSVSSKTHIYPTLLSRSNDSGIIWRKLNLDVAEAEFELSLPPEQLIRARLVDIEGQPVADLPLEMSNVMIAKEGSNPGKYFGVPKLNNPPKAWFKRLKTDSEGNLVIRHIAPGNGVYLQSEGNDLIAPHDLALNTGASEERGENDRSYRGITKNIPPGEIATLALAPARFFEGVVLLGDSDQPAANARISMWASQQEFGGSMISVEGKTNSEGRFRLNPKPGVRFGIIAYPPNGTPYQVKRLNDLRWKSNGASKQIEIRLDQGVLAQGTVVDAKSGKPLRGASVQYHPDRINNTNLTDGIVTGWQSIQKTDETGRFTIAVLPGPGTLLVHAANQNYVLREKGSREVEASKPGGSRMYAHAFYKINPNVDEAFESLKIELQPGVSVKGTLTDVDGNPIERALIISRLKISPTSPEWRAYPDEALDGKFEIRGLRDGEEYPVYFLDAKNRLGAAATISTKQPSPTVVLKPCGSAIAKFVNTAGEPVEGKQLGLHMVVTPGKSKYDYRASRRGETLADEDFASNLDQVNYQPSPKTNKDGEIKFPALIPGARYRFVRFVEGRPDPAVDFVAKSGETYDMGDLEVQIDN